MRRDLKEAFAAKRGYVLVRRGLTPELRDAVMRLGFPGLTFEKAYKRYLSQRAGSSPTPSARWTPTTTACRVSSSGSTRSCAGTTRRSSSRSIMRVQYVLEHEMRETVRAFSAKAAGGIVLDVRTGEVLALASLPNYEPNSRSIGGGRLDPQSHDPGRLRAGLDLQDLRLRASDRGEDRPPRSSGSTSASR